MEIFEIIEFITQNDELDQDASLNEMVKYLARSVVEAVNDLYHFYDKVTNLIYHDSSVEEIRDFCSSFNLKFEFIYEKSNLLQTYFNEHDLMRYKIVNKFSQKNLENELNELVSLQKSKQNINFDF